MSSEIGKVIREYRGKRIEGSCVDLVPFTEADVANVVEIRNREKNRYFMRQTYVISVASQMDWYRGYLERENDIYWCIYNKENQFIGTVRIYDIDEEKALCEHGSFIIAEEYSESAPYAVETEMLSIDFIFDILKMNHVINKVRTDNKVMNNLTKKLGSVFTKDVKIREVDYKYYLLDLESYKKNREKFAKIIEYWSER